jgi:hypothetical protein
MTPHNLLKLIIYISTTTVATVNGIMMIKEKEQIDISNLSTTQELYIFFIIYTQIYLILVLLYNILFCIYDNLNNCCSDKKITLTFSVIKVLYFVSGLVSHCFLMYYVFIHKGYIDKTVDIISILYITNIYFVILLTIYINIYIYRNKKNYNEIE